MILSGLWSTEAIIDSMGQEPIAGIPFSSMRKNGIAAIGVWLTAIGQRG